MQYVPSPPVAMQEYVSNITKTSKNVVENIKENIKVNLKVCLHGCILFYSILHKIYSEHAR